MLITFDAWPEPFEINVIVFDVAALAGIKPFGDNTSSEKASRTSVAVRLMKLPRVQSRTCRKELATLSSRLTCVHEKVPDQFDRGLFLLGKSYFFLPLALPLAFGAAFLARLLAL